MKTTKMIFIFPILLLMSYRCEPDFIPGDYWVCGKNSVNANGSWSATVIDSYLFSSCPEDYTKLDGNYKIKANAEAAAKKYQISGPVGGGSGGGGGGGSAMCNSAYVDPMPEGYVQSNSFCEYVYLYVCQAGYSPSSAEVREMCNTYKTFQSHDAEVRDCNYCK